MPVNLDDAQVASFRPVTSDNWTDLETLFVHHGNPNYCWCTWWRSSSSEYSRHNSSERKALLKSMVDSRTPVGVIGYKKGQPIGWCSIAPRQTYLRLERSPILKRVDDLPVWTIMCFFVLRSARGHHFSVDLLQAAVDYARAEGAPAVEGYPVDLHRDERNQLRGPGISYAFMGSVSTFEKVGFKPVAITPKGRKIMRIYLTPGDTEG